MVTTPVKIDSSVLDLARKHKKATGVPIQRFIEEAIMDKVTSLPADVQVKMGLIKARKPNKK